MEFKTATEPGAVCFSLAGSFPAQFLAVHRQCLISIQLLLNSAGSIRPPCADHQVRHRRPAKDYTIQTLRCTFRSPFVVGCRWPVPDRRGTLIPQPLSPSQAE